MIILFFYQRFSYILYSLIIVLSNSTGRIYGHIFWSPESSNISNSLDINNGTTFVRSDPNFVHRCQECLLITPTGHGHISPCPPRNTISCLRDNIYSQETTLLFQIRFENPNQNIQILNNGAFEDVDSNTTMMNDVIEGIFTFKTVTSGRKVMTLNAVSMKRFSILFCFCNKNKWRARFAIIFSTKNGVLGFKMTKKLFKAEDGQFYVPNSWKASTVLCFGVHSSNNDIDMTLRINANDTGININPFEAQVSWDCLRDEINLSDNLKSQNATTRLFAKHLYQKIGRTTLATLGEQRYVPDSEASRPVAPLALAQEVIVTKEPIQTNVNT